MIAYNMTGNDVKHTYHRTVQVARCNCVYEQSDSTALYHLGQKIGQPFWLTVGVLLTLMHFLQKTCFLSRRCSYFTLPLLKSLLLDPCFTQLAMM